MADVKGVITKRIGPLPVLAWIAIGAAIILVIRLRSGSRGGGAVGSPFGSPVDTGGVSPQTLDFQQSLLDLASRLRAPTPDVLTPPTAGVSTVTPTADTASLAVSPIANPSGGPIATTKTTGPGASVTTPAVSYAGPPVLGVPGFALGQTAQAVNGIPIAFNAHAEAPVVGAPTAPSPVSSSPAAALPRVSGFPSAAEVAEFYG